MSKVPKNGGSQRVQIKLPESERESILWITKEIFPEWQIQIFYTLIPQHWSVSIKALLSRLKLHFEKSEKKIRLILDSMTFIDNEVHLT